MLARTWALNEAAVEKSIRERMLEMVLEVDGRPLSAFGCDGMLCATPTGSTAYAFSAGGPVVWPQVEALLLVPSNAHALFARPMVISPDSQVAIEVDPAGPPAVLDCDGRRTFALPAGARVELTRGAMPVRMVRLDGQPVRRPAGPQVRPAGPRLARGAATPRHVRSVAAGPVGPAPYAAPMLAEMRIQGLGVIDDATLELDPGLTVLTGETGAGKTMVVTGLTLLGGGRAEASRVADGAARAVVEGRFSADAAGAKVADEVGRRRRRGRHPDRGPDGRRGRSVPGPPRRAVRAGRRAGPAGRGQRWPCTGRTTSCGCCARPSSGRCWTASPAAAVAEPLARYRAVRAEWLRVAAELVERRDGARRLAQEADLLRHGLTEIGAVDPQPGEDDELVAAGPAAGRRRRPARGRADRAAPRWSGPRTAAGWTCPARWPHRRGPAPAGRRRGRRADRAGRRLGEALALLADVGAELAGYLDRLDADPERLAAVLSRQAELKALTRKYAADVDGVLAWADAGAGAAGRAGHLGRGAGRAGRPPGRAGRRAGRARGGGHRGPHRGRRPARRRHHGRAGRSGHAGRPAAGGGHAADGHARGRRTRCGSAGALLVAGVDGVDEVELRLVAHAGRRRRSRCTRAPPAASCPG